MAMMIEDAYILSAPYRAIEGEGCGAEFSVGCDR
jgi:hypothetical protein